MVTTIRPQVKTTDHDRPINDNELYEVGEDDTALPPHSLQAEEAVLGSVLKRGLAIADVVPFLKPHHFYEPRHRYIYAAMAALFDRAASIDYHTIAEELEHQGSYELAGGLVYLAQLNLLPGPGQS